MIGSGPAATPIAQARRRWVVAADLVSRALWHASRLTLVVEVGLSPWMRFGVELASKQAWVVRPILKGVQAVDHLRLFQEELAPEKRGPLRLGMLANLIVFELCYSGAALFMGAHLLTGHSGIGAAGQVAMAGMLWSLPTLYGGIALHAIQRSEGDHSSLEATIDQLHQNTYDLLTLLFMGSCDALQWQLIDCSIKRWLMPLLGTAATGIELYNLWRLS